MKFRVTKINVLTGKVIDLGQYDERSLKAFLRGYKETKDSSIYECENSSWIYYIE